MIGSGLTILLLSDELVSIYRYARGKYLFVSDLHWQDPSLIENLVDILENTCKQAPIKILYDMVEQYYRRELVPKVQVFDQAMVLSRRLAAAFPNYPMRLALPIRVKSKDEKKKPTTKDKLTLKEIPYLFAAIPEHDLLLKIIEAIRLSKTTVKGLYLLPMESVSLVTKISKGLNQKNFDPERWTIFLSHHHGGGLRQIVTQKGELSLTRLTTLPDSVQDPNAWAIAVEREFSATMGYVSRYGYNPEAPLEVIVVGDPQATTQLESLIKVQQFHGITLERAAKLAGVPISLSSEKGSFSELLHVAWLGQNIHPILTFQNRELLAISRARNGAKAANVLMILSALGTLSYTGYQGTKLYESYSAQVDAAAKLSRMERDYKTLMDEINATGINIKLVQGSIQVYNSLEVNKINILDVMRQIRLALTEKLSVDSIKMDFVDLSTTSSDPLSVEIIKKQLLSVVFDVSLPARLRPEQANLAAAQLAARLRKELPDFDVSLLKAPADLTSGTEIEVSREESAQNTTPYLVQIGLKQKVKTP